MAGIEAHNCRWNTENPNVGIGSFRVNGVEQNPDCDGDPQSKYRRGISGLVIPEGNVPNLQNPAYGIVMQMRYEADLDQAVQTCKENLNKCSDEVMSLYIQQIKDSLAESGFEINPNESSPFVWENGKIGVKAIGYQATEAGSVVHSRPYQSVIGIALSYRTQDMVTRLNRFVQGLSTQRIFELDISAAYAAAKSPIRVVPTRPTAKTRLASPAENTAVEPRSKKVASGEFLSTILRDLNHKPNWSSQVLYFVGADGRGVDVQLRKASLLWPGNIVTIDSSGKIKVQLQTKAQLDKVSTLA